MAEAPEQAPDKPAPAAPSVAPGAAPLCFLVDEESSIRHFLSLVLHGAGIDTVELADGAALREALNGERKPDLVFHSISLESADAIESVVALGKSGFRGPVQLVSTRGAAVLDEVFQQLELARRQYQLRLALGHLGAAKVDGDVAKAESFRQLRRRRTAP